MDNNLKTLMYVFFGILPIVIILMFIMKAYSLTNMTEEDSQKVIELIEKTKITPKEAIVSDIKHEELRGPKYTIRVGLGGSRKPIPTINGLTTEERAKEWLQTAGLSHTLPTWKRLGEKHHIDYTLPLCIAWADSHLGKALKSKNNIGNVGNNDRGDTVHYESMDKGIEAIFRVLNNRYMKGHEYMGTLSGEGRIKMLWGGCNDTRVDQKCYATSKGVWSTNVTNCMSVLHNFEVNEWYKFRLK